MDPRDWIESIPWLTVAADFRHERINIASQWLHLPESGLMAWRRTIRQPMIRVVVVQFPRCNPAPLLTASSLSPLLYQLTCCQPAASSIDIPHPPTRIPSTV
jgi:hypothetical protein